MQPYLEKYLPQLLRSPLFCGCEKESITDWLSREKLHPISFRSGEYLMRRDSDRHMLGILLRGSAAVERKLPDGQMHMSRLIESDLFGAASIFCPQQEYVVDIRCLTDCKALFLTEEELLGWMQENPVLLKNYLCYLNSRIRFLNQRLDALSKSTVPSKLMTFFVNASKDGVYAVKSYTELANTLCLSRATLYRALDSLAGEGKILREGKKIILLEEL
ncbi:MAG: Crp/Fnr family transcriptional regulator [Clostridia bacterium]|nr:Crp/Fnr family transcriptional regulator [Clostridia bacterium]